MADSSSSSASFSSSTDSSDVEELLECEAPESIGQPFTGIQPWRFEPPGRSSEADEVPESAENIEPATRRRDRESEEWCLCGYCQTMWREEENICCQEVDVIKCKNFEAVEVEQMLEPPKCIVEHPGFQAVCLNYWVLQAAWLQYKQQYGTSAYEGSDHKKSRHIAYRQLVRWCWGSLGKDIRVPLPSCAVNCIRAHFQEPETLEDDMVFTGFQYADE